MRASVCNSVCVCVCYTLRASACISVCVCVSYNGSAPGGAMCVCVCVFGIYVCMYVRTSAHYEHEKQELADSGFTVEGTPSFSLSLSHAGTTTQEHHVQVEEHLGDF
jgi:hypothetical protein